MYTYVFTIEELLEIGEFSSADTVAGTNVNNKIKIVNVEVIECKYSLALISFPPSPFLFWHYFRYFDPSNLELFLLTVTAKKLMA
jgi:hypothetical protein